MGIRKVRGGLAAVAAGMVVAAWSVTGCGGGGGGSAFTPTSNPTTSSSTGGLAVRVKTQSGASGTFAVNIQVFEGTTEVGSAQGNLTIGSSQGLNITVPASVPLTVDLQAVQNSLDLSGNATTEVSPGAVEPVSIALSSSSQPPPSGTGGHMFIIGSEEGTCAPIAERFDGIPNVTNTVSMSNVPNNSSFQSIEAVYNQSEGLDEVVIEDYVNGDTPTLLDATGANSASSIALSTIPQLNTNGYSDVVVTDDDDDGDTVLMGSYDPVAAQALDTLVDPSGTIQATMTSTDSTLQGPLEVRVDPSLPAVGNEPVAFTMDFNGNLAAYLDPFASGSNTPIATFTSGSEDTAGNTVQPLAIDYDAVSHTLFVFATINNGAAFAEYVEPIGSTTLLASPAFEPTFGSITAVGQQPNNWHMAADVPNGSPSAVYFTTPSGTTSAVFVVPNLSSLTAGQTTAAATVTLPGNPFIEWMSVSDNTPNT